MMADEAGLRERIARGAPVLLDGALGTELEREGIRSELPLWTTHALLEAPQSVAAIHRRYALAGAEILTAETWVAAGARLIGGCCGTRAAHIAELAARFAGVQEPQTNPLDSSAS